MNFYLDIYAIIELARGNPLHDPYRKARSRTSTLNLLEVYFVFLQEEREDLVELCFGKHRAHAVEFPDKVLKEAALLRLRRKGATGRRLSYVDALGYAYAQEYGLRFVTRAAEFRGWSGLDEGAYRSRVLPEMEAQVSGTGRTGRPAALTKAGVLGTDFSGR
jgi:predicted nucleic acid-binding protein